MTVRRIRPEPTLRWTSVEEEQLRQQYPHMQTTVIAAMMGLTISRIYAKANKMGLAKSREYLDSPAACRLRRGDNVGAAYRYPKGHAPANKGLRRPGFAPGRMADTQFKKGQTPWNGARPLQSERINADGYVDRKISMSCKGAKAWIPAHRLIWMQAHGDILPGRVIAFRDRNKLNVTLENLECITLVENMRRNTVHNLPKPLAELMQLRGALIRQINRREGRREKQDRGSSQPPVRDARGAKGPGQANGDRARKGGRRSGEGDRR